ncbi:MAG: hypothetical protein AABZ60_24570 [Planctomycetota bacterium]
MEKQKRIELFWQFSQTPSKTSAQKKPSLFLTQHIQEKAQIIYGFNTSILFFIVVLFFSINTTDAQLYRSSVVGTEFDYILETDPSTFLCLEYKGQGLREMPDKSSSDPLIQQAFIFVSYFEDGTSIDMALDFDFQSEEEARKEALRYTSRLGKLPTVLRDGVKRMVIHKSEKDTTAFSDNGLIILYSYNATKRISTHDLEETIFHESVHAAWDHLYRESSAWLSAQQSDQEFVTHYAKKNPTEDLAESALFAYTLLHYPGRIPLADATKIQQMIPARIAFIKTLLPSDQPIFYSVGEKYNCDGSKTTFTISEDRESAKEFENQNQNQNHSKSKCTVDITNMGEFSDILSNALILGLNQQESVVHDFLKEAKKKYTTNDKFIQATTEKFGLDKETLKE